MANITIELSEYVINAIADAVVRKLKENDNPDTEYICPHCGYTTFADVAKFYGYCCPCCYSKMEVKNDCI